MKCFPRPLCWANRRRIAARIALSSTVLAAGAWLGFAKLISWSADTVAGTAIEAALFRSMPLAGGAVLGRRPPIESVPEMSGLIQKSPDRADLYAIRAEEEERQLDFPRAEADWKSAATHSPQKASALLDLADYYHRRLQPADEVQTLLASAKLPSQGLDRWRPEMAQPAWKLFERAIAVSVDAKLSLSTRDGIYDAWIARYQNSPEPYKQYLHFLVDEKQTPDARALEERIGIAFPRNEELQLEAEGLLARSQGGASAELDVYSHRFSPLWPAPLRHQYYELLKQNHQLRAFLALARTQIQADPLSLDPVLRVFFYYEGEDDRPAADRELLSWQSRRMAAHRPESPQELLTLAPLFSRVADYDESTHAYYTAYEENSSTANEKQRALEELISLLLEVPEQSFDLGRRDLSLYRNVAQMDRHPGFLNGILSLVLNSTGPAYEYQTVSQTANTYFHRAAASQFLDIFKKRFPTSLETAALEAKLFNAYAAYGQNEALVRLVPDWLAHNSNSPNFVNTALLLSDAYAATNRTAEEFALYDRLLAVESAKSDHVPLGPGTMQKNIARQVHLEPNDSANEPAVAPTPLARSPEYARVLDRYISRLTENHRLQYAIALYRKEIDRNPDDPGLYERLALFIEQNRLDAELAAVYEQAFRRFNDISWQDKLARFYLRQKQYAAYATLTRQITQTFDGSDLALFLRRVSPDAKLNPVLYRQVNLYAHERFPHNLAFIRNLLNAYRSKSTADPAAYERLLRENWFYDAGLRTAFFERLTRTGKLAGELAALPSFEEATSAHNIAAIQFRAEGNAWLTHFEASSPNFLQWAHFVPGDLTANERATSVERSLSSIFPNALPGALALAETAVKAAPTNIAFLTRLGDIYADHDNFKQAATWWNRIPAVQPGVPVGYLTSSTLFWDYFQYNQAIQQIEHARQSFGAPDQYAYQAGAIYENEGDLARAVDEYIRASLIEGADGENSLARNRLLTLAKRKATAGLIDQRAAAALDTRFNSSALDLRVDLLEAQRRPDDIRSLLDAALPRSNEIAQITEIGRLADGFGFEDIKLNSLQRIIALTADPVEKLQARLDVAAYRETYNDIAGAERDLNALLTENPMLLAVVRANVDFYWREKQYAKTVASLEAASSRAQPPYRDQLRREAVAKATDSGQYEVARRILAPLLAADPYNSDLLAQAAATYSRSGDSAGLVNFYGRELAAINSAALPAKERADRVSGLRRGYIAALVTAKQFGPALEQYESLLNRYPEDDALARETARFATQHGSAPTLLAYYNRAQNESPRDYRWPLVLARINTYLAHYPEALDAYSKAVELRPDRVDIFVAKADLETRLLRFTDADKTLAKLYDLTYHDSQYLVQRAAIQLRLANPTEAVRLLRAAYVDARPQELSGYLSVMRQLADWCTFSEVESLYKEMTGLTAGGNDWQTSQALSLEAQALASLHRPEEAVIQVGKLPAPSPSAPQDNEAFRIYATTIGSAAESYLTPEERSRFADFITRGGFAPKIDAYDLASAAGLEQVAASSLARRLQAKPDYSWTTLQRLQSSRLVFDQLGRELEVLGRNSHATELRPQLLRSALDAYASAGDEPNQLRLATSLLSNRDGYVDLRRFAALFTEMGSDFGKRLEALGRKHPEAANAVVQYVLSNKPVEDVVTTVEARGTSLSPTWTDSYKALSGLYFQSPGSWVTQSYSSVLGPRTVAAELASPSTEAVKGADWFYYAARFGDYLAYRKQPESADLLPASLEANPAASNSYVLLGDTYSDVSDWKTALVQYQNALQLSPARSDVHDRIAIVCLRTNRKDAAVEEWRKALRLLADRVEQGPLPPDYWTSAQTIFTHLNQAHLFDTLSSAAESTLLTYARRNNAYNFTPFVEGVLTDAPDQQRALNFLLAIARRANLDDLPDQILRSPLISPARKDGVYQFQLNRLRMQIAGAAGDSARRLADQLQQMLTAYTSYLLEEHRWQDAWVSVNEIQPAASRPALLLMRAAAHSGHLDELLNSYRAQPDSAPPGDQVLAAASALAIDGREDLALLAKEFEYTRELDAPSPSAASYFGLAEIRLAQKRRDEALELIRIVTTVIGAPFENLRESIRTLENAGLQKQAAQYAQQWKAAEPWKADAELAAARLNQDASSLERLRLSPAVPYELRARAAELLRALGKPARGSDELALLTRNTISPAEASQPYFVPSRIFAAHLTSSLADRETLYREAIAISPTLVNERLDLAEAALHRKNIAFGIAALESYSQSAYNPGQNSSQSSNPKLLVVQELAADAQLERKEYGPAAALYDQILAATSIDAVTRTRIQKLRDTATSQSRLASANAARQPVITNEIAQPIIVKPKLTSLPADGLP